MPVSIHISYLNTSLGELIIGSYEDKICLCDWKYRTQREGIDNRIRKGLNADFLETEECNTVNEAKRQILQYISKERNEFNLPIITVGTDFQKNVWDALLKIPYGKTDTYLELSKKLNNEKAIRAIASANGANAISILIPCHRIIGSDGSLVGYAGGLEAKKKLLTLEGSLVKNQLSLFSS